MKLTKLKITGIDKDKFIDFITKFIWFDYKKEESSFSVLIREESGYSAEHKSYRTSVLTIQEMNSALFIEILVPGKKGWISKLFGKYDTGSASIVKNTLKNHHLDYGFEYEILIDLEDI